VSDIDNNGQSKPVGFSFQKMPTGLPQFLPALTGGKD
jgi:hypothetical protein